MLTLPDEWSALIVAFAPVFSRRVFTHVQVLLVGAILTPGRRTVCSVLRVMGLSQESCFARYHRVLSRARWSALGASRLLLRLLVQTLARDGVVVIGLDDTLERRWGRKISARGIYRDPVRSSREHLVKASGLRWLSLMALVPIPWSRATWALPFLTALCPSERYYAQRGRTHKTLLERAAVLVRLVRRWLPGRALVVVADGSFAALEFLAAVRPSVTLITRLRLDAALYEPAPARVSGQIGRPRKKGQRLPTLEQLLSAPHAPWQRGPIPHWYGQGKREIEWLSGTAVWYHPGLPVLPLRWVLLRDPLGKFAPQALLCTDLTATPEHIVQWFVLRWQMEVTFEEARAHLGLESQRQWSDKAIARTTPALLGLYSLVVLLAHRLLATQTLTVRTAAWYRKEHPTFCDAMALVRRHFWRHASFSLSAHTADTVKIPRPLFERFTDILCYAA